MTDTRVRASKRSESVLARTVPPARADALRRTVSRHAPWNASEVVRFRRTVWAYYRTYGRHTLPWRTTRNPYRILVSEVMLQQTQALRVIPFYRAFLKAFPTPARLARAPLAAVLRAWQGLGYNRRAKMLQHAARHIVEQGMPRDVSSLEQLPGVGPYTARAIAAFAWNQDVVCIETNIRTVIIHHFFPRAKQVPDSEIERVLAAVLPKGRAREWYSALMDYGAYLKRSGITHNERSPSYVRQAAFRGSVRQARGAVVRTLLEGAAPSARLVNLLGAKRRTQVRAALDTLVAEGLVEKAGTQYMLAP